MVSSLLNWITSSQEYFTSMGFAGILLFAAIFFGAQFCLAPVAPLAMAAGVIFGMRGGFVAVTIGTALGAAFNFLISRHLARNVIASRLHRSEKFRLIDQAIGREGWKIVALLRFCPIPFGLANFCYGLTAVRFWPYMAASVLAIIPANLFFVWLGTSAQEGAQALLGGSRPGHPAEYVLMGIGLLAGFAALTYIGRIARGAIASADVSGAKAEPAKE
jgi:uncharacterized membrane protein YdjX (TVP38/TMEM64 family)